MLAPIRHLALSAAFLAALPAWAGGGPICPPQAIRVAYFEFGSLFSYDRGDKSGSGIDHDLVAELGKRSGCSFSASVMTRARIWSEIQAGRLDLTLAAVKTPERTALAWMVPYLQVKSVVLLSPRLPPESRSQQGFMANPKAIFGIVREFRHAPRYEAIIQTMRENGRLLEVTDTGALIRSLKSGEIMAAVSNNIAYPHYLEESRIPGRFIVTDWGPEDPPLIAHLMLSRQTFSEEESRKWRALLQTIRRDGTLQAIFERHVKHETARHMLVPEN